MRINRGLKRSPGTHAAGPQRRAKVEGEIAGTWVRGGLAATSLIWVLAAAGLLANSLNLSAQAPQEGSGTAPAGEAETQDEPISPARQNELLREHFRRLYPFNNDSVYASGSDLFVENYIDGQIDNFVAQLGERLSRLENNASVLAELHLRLRSSKASARAPDEVRMFADTLKQVEDDADFAYDYLSLAFPTFWTKPRFDTPARESLSREGLYQEQFDFLLERNRAALAKIRDYLFSNVSTVSLIELQEASMLSSLYSVREMAKWLRRQVE